MSCLDGKRFLIIDDDPLIATLLYSLLTRAGLNVVGMAANGQEAVEIALREHPDIILSDIDMPGMDGLESARQILAEYPACIIFVTACDDEKCREQSNQLGAAGYVLKPFCRQSLLEQMQEVVERWLAGVSNLT